MSNTDLSRTLPARLTAYLDAFNARDFRAALALFDDRALFEMPLLGQRLVGRREIAAGMQRIREVSESARVAVSTAKATSSILIAEGMLHAKLHRDPKASEIPLAVVLEGRGALIERLSMYLDARNYRLWADGPLFPGPSVNGLET